MKENLENSKENKFSRGQQNTFRSFSPLLSCPNTHNLVSKSVQLACFTVWISSERFQFDLIWYVRMLTDFGGKYLSWEQFLETNSEPCVENFSLFDGISLRMLKFNVDLMKKGFNFWFSSLKKVEHLSLKGRTRTEALAESQEIRKWNSTFHNTIDSQYI